MASFTVLYTRPAQDADAFLAEYMADHVPITERFPGMTGHTVTVFTGTPRGTEPPYLLMFHGTWDSDEDLQAAMTDASLMEASRQAMGMLGRYRNTAEMMIGEKR
ncbi:MAG TPA: EthD family reductase [Euzebya sp.]|nr:EthD family reductase [Euzebya sp.]